jgi:fluoride exporter
MHPIIFVMAGGALGAAARYLTGLTFAARWPMGTLTVNLIGGFAMGLLMAVVIKGGTSENMRLFAGVGVLGGFTTFSAFSLECWQLIERGQAAQALLYALASVVGAVVALALGLILGRTFA